GNFAFSLKLNLAKFSFNKGTMAVYWDVMGKFISSGVVDTLLPDIDRQYNINSYGFGSSFTFATKYKPEDLPLNTSISIELYKLRAHSNDVRQRTGPLYYPENNHKNNNLDTDHNLNPSDTKIIRVQLLLTYNPKHKEGTGDIFIRFNYSTNSFKVISGNISESNYNNNYLQFQVGYIVPLNGLFPEKTEDKSKKVINERNENEKFVM
ncbi:MAG: hypothetical protein RL641_265, partial [Candidatus Parcubacteria bacterium]